MHKGPEESLAARLTEQTAGKFREDGLLPLVVPASCRVEYHEGCGFHVAELATAGVDLDAVACLQLTPETPARSAETFGFVVALVLDGKPRVRVVLAYTCGPEALLVPRSRWVIRSPSSAITVLSPPHAVGPKAAAAPPSAAPLSVLIYPGGAQELCAGLPAPPAEEPAVEIEDETIASRFQQAAERLWYWELYGRQLAQGHRDRRPGRLFSSVELRHRVSASGHVVCTGLSVARAGSAPPGVGSDLLPPAAGWEQLELQLQALSARAARRAEESAPAGTKRSKAARRKPRARRAPQKPAGRGCGEGEKQAPAGGGGGDDVPGEVGDGEAEDQSAAQEPAETGPDGDGPGDAAGCAQGGGAEELDQVEGEPQEARRAGDDGGSECSFPKTPSSVSVRSNMADMADMAAEEPPPGRRPGDAAGAEEGPRGERRKTLGSSASSLRKSRKSWADLSEECDDDDDAGLFFFDAQHLRQKWHTSCTRAEDFAEQQWTEVGQALAAIPGNVSKAIMDTITDSMDVGGVHIPQLQVDVPERGSNTTEAGGDVAGTFSGPAWKSNVSELGVWYELRCREKRKVCGVAIRGDLDEDAYVEMLKIKVLQADGKSFDANQGGLYEGCHNAVETIEIEFEPVEAVSVRIYPVCWKNHIALHAALLEPASTRDRMQDSATKAFRHDARQALSGWTPSALGSMQTLGRALQERQGPRTEADIAGLIGMLYQIPSKVSECAAQLEDALVATWRKKAEQEGFCEAAQQWAESAPEELFIVANAQIATMDQVSTALIALEQVQHELASSVAECVLRGKAGDPSTSSELASLYAGLQRQHPSSPSVHSRSASSCPRNVDAMTDQSEPSPLAVQDLDSMASSSASRRSKESGSHSKGEFWVDTFVHHAAFRVGGPGDSTIWEENHDEDDEGPEAVSKEYHYSVLSKKSYKVIQLGTARAGEIIEVANSEREQSLAVHVRFREVQVTAALTPLRSAAPQSSTLSPHCVCVVFMDVDRMEVDNAALAVVGGRVCLTPGKLSWGQELCRQWAVTRRGYGYVLRFNKQELALDGSEVVLADTGCTWTFLPVGTPRDHHCSHLVNGSGGIGLDDNRKVVFTTDRARLVVWHAFSQMHPVNSVSSATFVRPVGFEPSPEGIFRAAQAWKDSRKK